MDLMEQSFRMVWDQLGWFFLFDVPVLFPVAAVVINAADPA
jgi:hypothetical protein